MPFLTLADGRVINGNRNMLRLVGKCNDLYPSDPIMAGLCDDLMDACDDIFVVISSAGSSLEKTEMLAARKACVEPGGKVHFVLSTIDRLISELGSGGHAVGNQMTTADLMIFANCCHLAMPHWEGVPTTVLDDFANINALRKVVATHPAVQSWYDDDAHGSGRGAGFKACRDL
mmetsp:Transcript_70727/g.127426  ORF Transcript_70727/g.127426 Transcript_70727/m.127426 type:complete len:174 (-) Transcript_70727:40-561(-)